MNTAHTTNTKRSRRSQIFAVLLFAFIYVGQPALVYAAAGSKAAPCQSRGEDCCCVKKVAAPVKSCCKSSQPHEQESKPTETSGCKCKVGSGEIPDQVPALPLDESSAAGDQVLGEWVRVHAKLSSSLLCGPNSMHDPPSARDGTAGCVSRLAQDFGTRQASSVGAWTLKTRGVAGYLAVLSVYLV